MKIESPQPQPANPPSQRGLYYWCVTHPVGTILLSAALVFLGLLAYFNLPVASLPDTDFPTIRINANLAGASPETMASSVATPLEVELSNVPGIQEMTSTSSTGSVSLTLQFALEKDINEAVQEVQAALNTASRKLPSAMSDAPRWRKINPADSPILMLSLTSDTMPITELSNYAETILAREISQIDGIGEVGLWGLKRPAIRIHTKPEKLIAAGVTLQDVREAVKKTSVNLPKGMIYGADQSSLININDQLFDPQLYDELIIRWQDGLPVYLKDIAQVYLGPENEFLAAWPNGEPGVGLVIFREPGTNITAAVDRVQAALPSLRAMLPAQMELHELSDRTRSIRASLHDIQITLLISVILVMSIMALFLRHAAATAITTAMLLITLVGTFAAMYLMGFSLNNLTLMALVVSVGFIVDDAIIVTENIYRYLEAGENAFQAALKGIREIGFTILSISISLIAVFIPLLFMGGVIGRLFKEFSLTSVAAVAISAILCLTLAPSLAALLMRKTGHTPNREQAINNGKLSFFPRLLKTYEKGLDWVLSHQKITLAAFFLTIFLSITSLVVIPKGFFPLQDVGFMIGTTKAASDISFDDMVKKHKQIEAILKADPDIQTFNHTVGSNGSMGDGRIMISLKDLSERDISIHDVINRLRPQFNEIPEIAVYLRAAQDINVGAGSRRAQYFYTLRSPNATELANWANQLTERLQQDPLFQDVSNDLEWDAHVVNLSIDRELAAQYGFTSEDVDNLLYDAFGQRQISEIQTQTNQYKIVLGLDQEGRRQLESLDYLYLRSALTQELVPLKTFLTIEPPSQGPVTIRHLSMQPAANISFNLQPGTPLNRATAHIESLVRTLQMPDHIHGSFQGTAQVFKETLSSQPLLILAAILAVYIILGVLYESFVHPLTILSTLPSAGIGAVLFLLLLNLDFSVMALIGVILLIGIVKKNGILLIDFAIHAMREQNLSPKQAIRQACLIRFRPILMTTIAAMLGAMPLMFAWGTGAELRQPLGVTIVGGLLISQLLTLFSTPVVFLALNRLFSQANQKEDQADCHDPQGALP